MINLWKLGRRFTMTDLEALTTEELAMNLYMLRHKLSHDDDKMLMQFAAVKLNQLKNDLVAQLEETYDR